MDPHPHHSSHNASSFWHLVSMLLGIIFGAAALLLGVFFIAGGIRASHVNHEGPDSTGGTSSPVVAPGGAAPTGGPSASNVSMDNGVANVLIKPGAVNPMSYDTPTFTVKSGQTVKVTFRNESIVPLQHNLCICKPGSKDEVSAEAAKMMTSPNALERGFIPETPSILWHTKLLNPKESGTLEFTAPAPGDYPYLCTFPGHAIIMNGVMKVE